MDANRMSGALSALHVAVSRGTNLGPGERKQLHGLYEWLSNNQKGLLALTETRPPTVLVQQLTGNDCVLAAIAMAVGKTYGQLWSMADTAAVVESRGVADWRPWLNRAGLKEQIDFDMIYADEANQGTVHAMLWKRRALLSVASLNHKGGYHAVYWDGENVWDPSTAKTYSWLSSCRIVRVFLLV